MKHKRKLSKSELVTNEYRERFTMWYFGIEEDIIVFISELLKEEVDIAKAEEREKAVEKSKDWFTVAPEHRTKERLLSSLQDNQ